MVRGESRGGSPGVFEKVVKTEIAASLALLPGDDRQDQLDAVLRVKGVAQLFSFLEERGGL
jgi:hypothetical protein